MTLVRETADEDCFSVKAQRKQVGLCLSFAAALRAPLPRPD